ncbi:MFS transporter [Amaricoccus solimangrovi]|uniref:MFS transporter n=1 Tax=Amaricoccus solimangrovi TaxID=2589815 RepID=A0A501WQJ0_9RHOB|nr:MFS transporter [Amaricoccus solimangrovi]TPE51739.1 MFS transporter [Amaricoccus solimangrovi]
MSPRDEIGPAAAPASTAVPAPAAPPPFTPKPPLLVFAYALASVTAAITQGLGTSLVSANLAQIAGPLQATQTEASWLMAAYLIPNVSLSLILYKLRTQYGIRNFCEIAIIPYVLVSLAHLWVTDFRVAIALRFFAGAAAAPIASVAFLYMLEIFPPRMKLNIGLCLALIGIGLATPVAGLISPSLLDARDLRGLYLLELGLALVTFGFIYLLPLASPPRQKVISALDVLDYLLFATAMGCLAVFFTMGRIYWWVEADWLAWVLIAAIASGTLVAMIELNRRQHLIDVRWITSREIIHFTGILLVFRILLSEQSSGAISFLRQLGLQNGQMAGLYWAILATSVVSGLVCAAVMKPGREAAIHLAALVMIALGAWLDSHSTALTRPREMYLSQAIMAFGSGLFLPPAMAVGFSAALSKGLSYVVSFFAVFLFTQKVGAFIGSALFGTFVTWREQFHSAMLTARLDATDPLVAARLAGYAGAYARVTPDAVQRAAEGASLLAGQVRREAYVLAYDDAFRAIFLLALAAIALLLLDLAWTHRHRFAPRALRSPMPPEGSDRTGTAA